MDMKNKMTESKQIDIIINDIKVLDYDGKLELLEKLVRLIRSPEREKIKKGRSLLDLRGLGKEIWKDINVDEYIDKERNSWD
jgi:hypothetical protein